MTAWLRAHKRWTRSLVAIGVVLVLLVVNAVLVDSETKPADRDGPGFVVELGRDDLHVQVDGNQRARPLVLLHGLANSSRAWDRLVPLLARRYRVIRVDLLGHGKSAKPTTGYDPPGEARDLRTLMTRMGLCRPVLVAHSLGGFMGSAIIAQNREAFSAAVLIGVAPRSGFSTLPFMAKVATTPLVGELTYRITPGGLVRNQLSRQMASGSPRLPDQFVEDFRAMTYESFKQSGQRATEYLKAHPNVATIAASGLPTLAVIGDRDRIVRPSEADVWRQVPNVRVDVMHGVGHTPQWERPPALASLISSFLNEHPQPHCTSR
jgi:pimeloyl-ACP methyl ester carboxylesterase